MSIRKSLEIGAPIIQSYIVINSIAVLVLVVGGYTPLGQFLFE